MRKREREGGREEEKEDGEEGRDRERGRRDNEREGRGGRNRKRRGDKDRERGGEEGGVRVQATLRALCVRVCTPAYYWQLSQTLAGLSLPPYTADCHIL